MSIKTLRGYLGVWRMASLGYQVVCLDAGSGKELWKTKPEAAAWAAAQETIRDTYEK